MAESAGVEARQLFCQCNTTHDLKHEMEKLVTELKCLQTRLAAAQTGECKVRNNSSLDITALQDLATSLKETANNVADLFTQHITMHPRHGRAAEDSGYSSQTHSTLMGMAEMSVTDPRRPQSCCNGLPIQEEGDTTC